MGVKPIRRSALLIIAILLLMSTPIGQADEGGETILHIHFLTDGSPLELQNAEIELVNIWSGQIIHQEITNGTDVQIALENSEVIRLNIKIQNRTTDGFSSSNLQRIPLIQPNMSEITIVEANFLENIPIILDGFEQETSFRFLGNQTIDWSPWEENISSGLPNGTSGWIESHVPAGDWNLIYWNGSQEINAVNQGNLRLMAQDHGWNGTILVRHSPSGWENSFVVNGELDHILPRIDGGKWHMWRLIEGIPEMQSHSFDDALFESLDSWLSSPPIPINNPHSTMYLDFDEDEIENSATIYANWDASIRLPSYIGHPMLPFPHLGITYQIDRFLGNWDGVVDSSESILFSEKLHSLGWIDAKETGCCSLNHESMKATNPIYPTGAHLDPAISDVFQDGMSWGWDESGRLFGNSGNSEIQILGIPFRANLRDTANLSIELPHEWELRYSPQNDVLNATAESIHVYRSELMVTSEITLNIAKNEPPAISIDGTGATENYAILGGPINLSMTCVDNGPDFTEMRWRITDSNGLQIVNGAHLHYSTDSSHEDGDEIRILAECVDSHGSIGSIDRYLILDGNAPQWSVIMLEDHPSFWAQLNHSMDKIYLEVNATSTLIFDFKAEDDNGEPVSITLTSNRSEGWERSAENRLYFAELWPQGDEINGMHMTNEERHLEREPAIRWIQVSISDSVGNIIEKNWSITSLDLGAPVPRPALLIDNETYGINNIGTPSSLIEIDMDASFDDLNKIEDILWSSELNGQILFENESWEIVSRFTLSPLNAGRHDLVVSGIDLSGNIGYHSMTIEIHPDLKPFLSITDVMVPSGIQSGRPGEITVVIANSGSESSSAEVCVQEQCVSISAVGATLDGPGITSASLTFDSLPAGSSPVSVKWDIDTETYSSESKTPSIEPAWRESARFIIKVMLIAYCAGILFDRRFGDT